MRWLRWPRPRDDGGFTLAETLVAMVVATVVMGAAAMMFVAALRTNRSSTARVSSVNAARVGVAEIGRSLRTAIRPSQLGSPASTPAVLVATPTSLRFYANIDGASETVGPSLVTFDMTAGTLVQKVQKPAGPADATNSFTYCDDTLPSCSVRTTVLATGVASGSGFVYYDSAGAVLAPAGSCGCLADDTTRDSMNGVDVKLAVTASGTTAGPSTFVTRVQLVNQDAYRSRTP